MQKSLGIALLVGCAALLACESGDAEPGPREGDGAGDGDGEAAEAALSGTAAVGAPIAGGMLVARCADGSSFTESVRSDASGQWSGVVARSALPCALEVRGGDSSDGIVLHGFAAAEGTANVTPLTDLVVAYAFRTAPASFFASGDLQSAGATLATALAELVTALREAGFDVPDGDPFTTRFEATADDPWDQLLEQLKEAIEADPTLEDHADLVARLQTGMLELPAAPADDMDAGSDAGAEPDASSDGDGGMENTAPASVNAALVGAYRLTFRVGGGMGCGSSCSYEDGQSITAVVGADDSLTIDSGTKLTSPYYRLFGGIPHVAEIIWRDGDLEYALTDNESGAFSEINVGDLTRGQNGFPGFVGQMTTVVEGGAAIVARYAGRLGISHVFRGAAPAWNIIEIGEDGSLTFEGGAGPNVSVAQLGTVSDRVAVASRVDVEVTFDLNGDGMVDSSDRLELWIGANGRLHDLVYPISAQASVGVLLGDLANLPAHDGTALPETSSIAATVGDTPMALAINDERAPSASNMVLDATLVESSVLQQRLMISVEGAALTAGTTYACHERAAFQGADPKVQLILKTGPAVTAEYSTANGGRCSIRIDSVTMGGQNDAEIVGITGTFVGELFPFRRNLGGITVDDGVFRWTAP